MSLRRRCTLHIRTEELSRSPSVILPLFGGGGVKRLNLCQCELKSFLLQMYLVLFLLLMSFACLKKSRKEKKTAEARMEVLVFL